VSAKPPAQALPQPAIRPAPASRPKRKGGDDILSESY
jgi:hypothetical protein